MDYRGKVHLTFIFKADQANVAEGDRLFAGLPDEGVCNVAATKGE